MSSYNEVETHFLQWQFKLPAFAHHDMCAEFCLWRRNLDRVKQCLYPVCESSQKSVSWNALEGAPGWRQQKEQELRGVRTPTLPLRPLGLQ